MRHVCSFELKETVMKSPNMRSLLGGALVGAASMYLMDPDMGQRRRKYVAKQAGEYMGEAGDVLHSGWDKVSGYAGDLGHTIGDKAQEYGGRLSDLASQYSEDLVDRAKGTASSWRARAEDARADMAEQAGGWLSRGRKILHRYGNQAQEHIPSRGEIGDTLNDYGKSLWKRVRGVGSDINDRAGSATKSARSYIGGEERS